MWCFHPPPGQPEQEGAGHQAGEEEATDGRGGGQARARRGREDQWVSSLC